MLRFTILFMFVTCFISSIAMAEDSENIFKADLSNHEIAATLSAFEDVCLPFILHVSELTQANDRAHYQNILKSQGYIFKEDRRQKYRIFDGTEGQWRPKSQQIIGSGGKVPDNTKGKFTVFNGLLKQNIVSTQTTVNQTGEILLAHDIPVYKTGLSEIYESNVYARLSSELAWNPYESQKQPAKSCTIKFKEPSFSNAVLVKTVVKNDEDWKQRGMVGSWYQCVAQNEGRLFLTMNNQNDGFSIKVERIDTFVEKGQKHGHLCDFKYVSQH